MLSLVVRRRTFGICNSSNNSSVSTCSGNRGRVPMIEQSADSDLVLLPRSHRLKLRNRVFKVRGIVDCKHVLRSRNPALISVAYPVCG